MEPKPESPLLSQGNQTANARRKYLHVLEGGTLKPHDLSLIVADMEAQDARIAALEAENARLADQLVQRVIDDLAELNECGLLEAFIEANSDLVARLRAALAPKEPQ